MSPHKFLGSNAYMFDVDGSVYLGQMSVARVHDSGGVVRLSNFSLIKFFL